MNPLYPHQQAGLLQGVPVLQQEGAFYFAWDPGGGKTLGAICAARLLRVNRVVVVTTPSGVGVWRNEIKKWWPNPVPVEITTWGMLAQVPRDKKRWAVHEDRIKAFLALSPDMVIFDEAHKAKTPSTRRTRVMRRLAQKIHYKLYLSGTPTHSPLDYWAPYSEIMPNHVIFRQTFTQYKQQIATLHPEGWVTGFRPLAVEEVQRAIAPYTHYFDSSELNLPAPVETVVPVDLDDDEQEAYREMEKELVAELGKGRVATASIVLTLALRLQQITSGFLVTTEGETVKLGESKLEACLDLIDQRPDRKIVVAAEFIEDLNRLEAVLWQAGRQTLRIDGSTSSRTQIEEVFQHSSEPFVLLIQDRSGGESLTFNAAHTLIFYSYSQSSIVFRQVQGRVYGRLNDVNPTGFWEFLYLAGDHTVDEAILSSLQDHLDTQQMAKRIAEEVRSRTATTSAPPVGVP